MKQLNTKIEKIIHFEAYLETFPGTEPCEFLPLEILVDSECGKFVQLKSRSPEEIKYKKCKVSIMFFEDEESEAI